MIIQLDGSSTDDLEAARGDLAAMAASWGHELTDAPALTPAGPERRDDKAIDPVSLSALIVSIPAAALAVLDLADRIRKRHRAGELIDNARQLATRHICVYVLHQSAAVELTTLDPDQLLDLLADDKPIGLGKPAP